MTAVVEPAAGAFGFQPVMLPVIEANRKTALHGAEAHAPGRVKSVADPVVLATVPVGNDPGMVIVWGLPLSTTGLPDTSPRKSCVVLVPLLETQNGLDAVFETPQGLTSNGSSTGATPGESETKFV